MHHACKCNLRAAYRMRRSCAVNSENPLWTWISSYPVLRVKEVGFTTDAVPLRVVIVAQLMTLLGSVYFHCHAVDSVQHVIGNNLYNFLILYWCMHFAVVLVFTTAVLLLYVLFPILCYCRVFFEGHYRLFIGVLRSHSSELFTEW